MKTLVCLLPGLGDALAATPITSGAQKAGDELHVLSMLRPVSEYAAQLPGVAQVTELPLLTEPLRSMGGLLSLRKGRYDRLVLPFPATRWQYFAVARAVAARILVAHEYAGLSAVLHRTTRYISVPLRGGHRYWENARLAQAMGFTVDPAAAYATPAAWQAATMPNVLGVSIGTMRYKGNESRRWPIERFAEVISRQVRLSREVRVFIGPHESEDLEQLRKLCAGSEPRFIRAPLSEAARLIAECQVFLSNDAGLAHIAAGVGCRTLVLFGMTSPVRALPIGNAVALRPSSCPPCNDEGLSRFDCVLSLNFRCVREDLPVGVVHDALSQLFGKAPPYHSGVQESDFRLYGRPRPHSLR